MSTVTSLRCPHCNSPVIMGLLVPGLYRCGNCSAEWNSTAMIHAGPCRASQPDFRDVVLDLIEAFEGWDVTVRVGLNSTGGLDQQFSISRGEIEKLMTAVDKAKKALGDQP